MESLAGGANRQGLHLVAPVGMAVAEPSSIIVVAIQQAVAARQGTDANFAGDPMRTVTPAVTTIATR
jgi:hypothetical protein